MRRLLFSADGSSGDLLPMVLLAQRFQQAGYEVCVCGSSEYAQMARDFQVPFEGYAHSYSEAYLDRQRTGYLHSMRENIEHQERLFQSEYDLLTKLAPHYDVLVNFLAEIFVPSIAEAFEMPNVKLFTMPVVRCERYGPPSGLPFVTEQGWFNRLQWQAAVLAANRLFSYTRTVNRLRRQLSLPPVRDILGNNSRCDHMMIGVYEELLPPCRTWSFDYSYIGPCLPSAPVALSQELEDFLAAGPKPIYIGFGSMRHPNGQELSRQLVEAVRSAGLRLILARSGSSIGAGLEDSEDLLVLKQYPIPHHVLFPRLRAAVHQGSWIMTHLAARAGLPQLILPQASDQYLWADIVARQGLGPRGVDMNRLRPRKLAAAIAALAGCEGYREQARALSERVAGVDGVANALRLFERLEGRLRSRKSLREV